ncbi:MAG: PilZ domain-containing protein [Mizugakiibacter sp.]|uniref:PilZ domain-containing protein n=1 Tax=Mizugakiibacter sp. TaxID=1972610 RepID=UPI0031CBB3E0|nr:PilZ domain-containing protein [Xanthomonadaceae bacterium]
MSEQRRARRKHVADVIEVGNAITGASMGRIGNLSRTGLMLISHEPVREDALYQLSFRLAGADGVVRMLEMGVHEQWSEPAAVPGQYWAGFRIIALGEDDAVVLDAWLADPNRASL